jgi:hypothetical protein
VVGIDVETGQPRTAQLKEVSEPIALGPALQTRTAPQEW